MLKKIERMCWIVFNESRVDDHDFLDSFWEDVCISVYIDFNVVYDTTKMTDDEIDDVLFELLEEETEWVISCHKGELYYW